MSLRIIRNDITRVSADAIVNTANPHVAVGYGVDSAVYEAAGKEKLLAERARIGEMNPGDVAVTPAFDLDAKYIIHTVGPVWAGGTHGEVETVAKCYRDSLAKAKELQCESVAFPLLSSGTYGFPKDIALKTAISEISEFLFSNEMTVYMVVYNKKAFEISENVFHDVTEYIRDNEVKESGLSRYRTRYTPNISGSRKAELLEKDLHSLNEDADIYSDEKVSASYKLEDKNIDDVILHKEETFQERLFRLIDRKGLEDTVVYKKANLDRKLFSKIRSNVDYNPSKKTALALAVALELNLDETKDLLLRAGIALSRSNVFDLIIAYCFDHHITDIYEINCILFKYGQPTLGT